MLSKISVFDCRLFMEASSWRCPAGARHIKHRCIQLQVMWHRCATQSAAHLGKGLLLRGCADQHRPRLRLLLLLLSWRQIRQAGRLRLLAWLHRQGRPSAWRRRAGWWRAGPIAGQPRRQ